MITVGIDIDGVIYNIIDHIIDRFLPNIPKGYQPKNWECFEELGITRKEFFDYYSKCWYEASYIMTTGLKYTNTEAFQLIRNLKNDGYRISIITKRPKRDVSNTLMYLDKWYIQYDSFINICDDKDKTKENFDILIDDYPGNMPQDLHGNKRGILLTKTWNKDYIIPRDLKESGIISRVDNFNEAMYLILSYYPNNKPLVVNE